MCVGVVIFFQDGKYGEMKMLCTAKIVLSFYEAVKSVVLVDGFIIISIIKLFWFLDFLYRGSFLIKTRLNG